MTGSVDPRPDVEVTVAEVMCASLARRLEGRHNAVQGFASPLPTAAIRLARTHHDPDVVHLSASGAVDPEPDELPVSSEDARLLAGATAYFTSPEVFDMATTGDVDVMFIGSAQVDREGNMNASFVGSPDDRAVQLTGGGGSGSLLPLLDAVFAWRTEHSPRTFPERVDFVTAAGNLRFVTTPLCNFEVADGELAVASVHPGVDPGTVRERTGWDVRFESTATTDPPTEGELAALERVDPTRTRRVEFDAGALSPLPGAE